MIAWVACCFVVMGLLYQAFGLCQAFEELFYRDKPYVHLGSQIILETKVLK